MGELIEIIFEDVEKHALASFVMELTGYGKAVKDYRVLSEYERNVETDWQDCRSVLNIIEEITGGSLFVNLVSLSMEDITLSPCALRVIQYDDRFDLEISFDSENAHLCEYMLCRFAAKMAERYHISNFYAGIEPASDQETRIFTCDKPGPLFPGHIKPLKTTADETPAMISA